MVCTYTNASFGIGFISEDGAQSSIMNSIVPHNPVSRPMKRPALGYAGCVEPYIVKMSYAAMFEALHYMLSGNLTLSPARVANQIFIQESSSRVLHTGMIGCDEIQNNPWDIYNSFRDSNVREVIGGEPWIRRNRTLSRAIEDLAKNMTISMLSDPKFLYFLVQKTLLELIMSRMPSPNLVNVTYYTYENEYHSSPLNLWQSYDIAAFFTTCAIILGLFSLRSNGLSHSTSFSAIMSTTRNLQLDELVFSQGQDIGAEPLPEAMMKTKLKFGTVFERSEARSGEFTHVGFGFESRVQILKGREMI